MRSLVILLIAVLPLFGKSTRYTAPTQSHTQIETAFLQDTARQDFTLLHQSPITHNNTVTAYQMQHPKCTYPIYMSLIPANKESDQLLTYIAADRTIDRYGYLYAGHVYESVPLLRYIALEGWSQMTGHPKKPLIAVRFHNSCHEVLKNV